MKRKICIITGTRAEYGLLRWVIDGIKNSPEFTLQLIVTGMHLSHEYGETFKIIEQDGFEIDRKVELNLTSDTPVGISMSMGHGFIGFAKSFNELKPDLIMVLGDRFEIMAGVTAALPFRIPVAHIHGGELTEGLIDEAIRHSITKMSHFHFVAAPEYKKRVIQLGEQPDSVYLVGGLGVDSIKRLKLLNKLELEQALNFKFGKKNLLVTYHPVTLEKGMAKNQMLVLLEALEMLADTNLIFTYSNADTEGKEINRLIEKFVSKKANRIAFKSLGQLKYLSCMSQVDGVVGNSSSGLIEAPSFKKGTINIGDRQRGRLIASSVIECFPNRKSILDAIKKLYSKDFQNSLSSVVNPYGEGFASEKILTILKNVSFHNKIKKKFNDIEQLCE